jgi:hypothetical protein
VNVRSGVIDGVVAVGPVEEEDAIGAGVLAGAENVPLAAGCDAAPLPAQAVSPTTASVIVASNEVWRAGLTLTQSS